MLWSSSTRAVGCEVSDFCLLGLTGTVKVKLVWKDGTMPDASLSRSFSATKVLSLELLVPLVCRWRRGGKTVKVVIGLKLAGRKPKSGEGEGEGAGEKGDWFDIGENEGVPDRELPRDTSIVAASHSSKSKREKSCGRSDGRTRRGRESVPRLLVSLLSRDVSSQSNSLLALPRKSEGVAVPELLPPPLFISLSPPVPSISLVRIERCREQ